MIKDLTLQQERKLANRMYYGGGVTKKYEGGGAFAWKDDKTADLAGAGLSVASSATAAFDKTPDKYDGMDVAGSALKYATMGAAAGPVGALIGGAVGLGVGLFTKKKQEKEKEKAELLAEQRKQQDEGLANYMKDQEEFAGYEKGGVIKKGSKEYRKAYDTGNLANMVDIDGEQTAVFPDMDEITLTGNRNSPLTKADSVEYSNFLMNADSGAERMRKGQSVSNEQKEAADYLKKANPVEYNMRQGDKFSDMMESFGQNVATSPLFFNQGVGNAIAKGAKYEYQALKGGIEGMKKAQHWYPAAKKGLQTFYHGNKLMAMPGFALGGEQLGSNIIAGKASVKDVAKFGKTAINFYNPFKSINATSGIASYLKGGGKDLYKAGLDVSKGNYAKAAVRTASTFVPSKGLRQYAMKVGKDYIPNFGYETGGMTKGAYSHSTNPLTVVDKNGQDTGMELTGGEGVFDKPAMDRIKSMLAGGKVNEVGAFINNEMKTWKHK